MGAALSWGLPPWGPSWKDTWQGWGLSTHKETRLPALLSPRVTQTPVGDRPSECQWANWLGWGICPAGTAGVGWALGEGTELALL